MFQGCLFQNNSIKEVEDEKEREAEKKKTQEEEKEKEPVQAERVEVEHAKEKEERAKKKKEKKQESPTSPKVQVTPTSSLTSSTPKGANPALPPAFQEASSPIPQASSSKTSAEWQIELVENFLMYILIKLVLCLSFQSLVFYFCRTNCQGNFKLAKKRCGQFKLQR